MQFRELVGASFLFFWLCATLLAVGYWLLSTILAYIYIAATFVAVAGQDYGHG